ncbi:MAG: HEAT repeat domain-containing protein, partial [Bacteroidota bacterium]|nr:HEAT repeat domain-containing protein [Bacteroidota bacterium]
KEYARQTIDCYMPLVRNEAEMAFFYLDKYHSLDFLKNFNRVLSEWHQLHIYNLIVRKSIPPPDFSVFYTEKNDSVVAFALQMTRLFRQKNNADLVIPYLRHTKDFVRKQAILTLRDFEMNEAVPDLIDIYGKEEPRLKIEIIRTLAFLSTNEAMEFLVNEMASPDKMIRIEIIQSLDHYHRSQLLNTIENFDGLEEIVRHISDGHIL